MNLYEINHKIQQLLDSSYELSLPLSYEDVKEDPSYREHLEQRREQLLYELKEKRREKLEGVICYIKNLAAQQQIYEQEIARLKAAAKQLESKLEWLKSYTLQNLAPGEEFCEGIHKARVKETRAVEVQEELLPAPYWREKVVRTPNKEDLAKELKCGAEIPGAVLVTRKHLVVA